MYIFGGVDTTKQRFNDFYSYDIDKRLWLKEECSGDIPKARTFHRAVSFGNIMYLLGGFDGSRLNDMHIIALPVSLYEEDRDYLRMSKRPQTSGSILTVPSDIGADEFDYDADEKDLKYTVYLLKKQVEELSQRLKLEEERNDMCKICYTKEIDTVFLECAHRFSCHICANTLKKCPF